MCGVAGIISREKALDRLDCLQFIDSLSHRGPDGRGVYFDPETNVFLGHRRLKILDLTESGAQPMFSQNGRYVIVFNGEIYNFLELREELQKRSYVFKSDSDTEVILAAYQEWREDCQYQFNGMWAFAIWDQLERSLFLSRDRFGVKPLYFRSMTDCFSFASEIKAFDRLDFDLQKIADCLEDPLVLEPTQETLFQHIQKVPAGCYLTFTREGIVKIKQWWNTLSHLPTLSGGFADRAEALKELLFDACSLRMRSDVALGTALSGGLDSSSILCSIFHNVQSLHKRWPTSWQRTFTAVFPNTSQDELAYAKLAASHTKSQASYLNIEPKDLINHLEECLYSIEDIFDPPIGPWLLYRSYRKQGISISIDGHGADELFCGYHHHFETALVESLLPFPKFSRLKTLWPNFRQMDTSPLHLTKLAKRGLQTLFPNQNSGMYQLLKRIYWRQYSGYGRYGWLKIPPSYRHSHSETNSNRAFKKLSPLNRSLYLDFHYKTLPSILRNFDRCSMAHGVEVRAPFMDWRMVTFAFSLPSSDKAGHLGTKNILRQAMVGILPEKIRLRRSKIGFANPIVQWIASDLKEYIMDTVLSQTFRKSDIWNGDKIANEASQSLATKDYVSLRKVWEFVLAHRLMSLFKKSAIRTTG